VSDITELSEAECRSLLDQAEVGRLAFVTPHGLRLVPLNYAANRGVIVFVTTADSELGRYGEGGEAVFEIDHVDPATHRGWSVVASGRLQRPSQEDVGWDMWGWRNPTPWVPESRWFHLELPWTTLTGRQLG
jgi:nitroimidazol reductase NimA-like FMN-containing flavoprotein (pyridoxamine 5'-phosphate oxidase superfamily)